MYNPFKYGAAFVLIYFVLVPDSMADTIVITWCKTPMGAAEANMDKLAARAICGTVSNVPEKWCLKRYSKSFRFIL